MNRNVYRLKFNTALGAAVPVAETVRSRGKTGPALSTTLLLAGLLLGAPVWAELPFQLPAGFVSFGTADNHTLGNQMLVNQVGDKSILNWETFNISPGHLVQFQQVGDLTTQNLVQDANFTSLNRIWDANPSVIAGIITQGAGQKANIILVNQNGIAFMGSSQVNLNSFTASSLNIADSFILNSFLTTSTTMPQFDGTGGFIKVFDGARITAGSQGRVMLLAPTVVNMGQVEAPGGQVIAAAGTKMFLSSASGTDSSVRGLLIEVDSPAGLTNFDTVNSGVKDGMLDGQTVALTDPVLDKLGHVTNLGELSASLGNVTMVGYAVNQQGIARATTSVVTNGSVYLLAKDKADSQTNPTRGGQVVLANGSLTEVLPDVLDNTGALDGLTGAGLLLASQVKVLGQDVRIESGAVINAPAGEVNLIALDNPGSLATSNDPFTHPGANFISTAARIHIASGARINVAGLENVQVSTARNGVEVELRGDELKDSLVNQDGPLRGQKVYVDINRALANANAGIPTLIAKDSLEAYQARLERTVAERSTAGGVVSLRSQGEAIIESGAVIDLSGGSVLYTPGIIKTTLLTSRGKLTDIANALADVRYDGNSTRYVIDYKRWNMKEVIDLGQSFNFDPGYVEGKNAGALEVMGLRTTFMQADVQGRTSVGALQRDTGIQPDGAHLTLGSQDVTGDFKLNQQTELDSAAAALPAGFKFGDALSPGLINILNIKPVLLGKDKIAKLEIFSNQAVVINEALRAPQGGSVHITAQTMAVNADIEAASGSIFLNTSQNQINTATTPLDISVADGVTLSVRGAWVNELYAVPAGSDEVALVHGGKITLSAADNVALGQNTLLDATGGGRLKVDGKGKVVAGNGGEISLSGIAVTGVNANLRGYGLAGGEGGTLTLSSNKIQIGGTPGNTYGTLNLDAGFFERGGFSDFKLAGLENMTLAAGVTIKPTVLSLELQPGYTVQPGGSRMEDFTRQIKLDDLVRQATNLSLKANFNNQGPGDLLIGEGARIAADPKAKITLEAARLLDIQGRITAPGGSITATLHHAQDNLFDASNSIWLGQQAILDVSGVALTYTDSKRLTQGEVLAGGSVTLNAEFGYAMTEAGSNIKVAGAAPVRLDILNEAGGLGQWVGSDAGSLSITAREGVLLDGAIMAQAGGTTNRGGAFNLVLGNLTTPLSANYPTGERLLDLAQTVVPQANGLLPGESIPAGFNGQGKLSATTLEEAGFARITLKSRDAIRLENDLNLGSSRVVPLKEVKLDSPRIETMGGDVALKAESLRLGNYDRDQQGVVNTPLAGSGTLKADAQLLELAGNLTLTSMARAELNGAQEIRLSGIGTNSIPRPTGTLSSAADLVFSGAVVAPATYSKFTIQAPNRMVEFNRTTNSPVQPLSAFGSLTVTAKDIVQDGNIWAPFGQLDFAATDTLTFKNGSLTSVAAIPGSLIPFGKLVNGRDWIYTVDGIDISQTDLTEKFIHTQAASIDMQAGATVNLAGGGDLQAYEFSVGPGGSRDILNDAGTYAILPGYTNGFAPGDTQESAGFDRMVGDAAYLAGIAGLPAGMYTLLPAHYALLPGAYAVRLSTGVNNLLPGMVYDRQDGIQVVPGYFTDSRALSGGPRDALWSGFEVLTREQVLQRSEINLTRAPDFFAASLNRPQDGGLLSMNTTGGLNLDAIFKLAAASGGRGAKVDISALKLAITSGTSSGIDLAATRIEVDKLNAMGAASLFLGGTRSTGSTSAGTTTLTVGADELTLTNDSSQALKGEEIILAAKKTLTLKSGSTIEAQGTAGAAGSYTTAGSGALVRAAATTAIFTRSDSVPLAAGVGMLAGEAGSTIHASNSITLDATTQNDFKGIATFVDGSGNTVAGNLAIGAERVNFGDAPGGSGLVFSQAELNGFNSLNSLTLTSYTTFDLYGAVDVGGINALGKPTLQTLNLLGAGLAGINNGGNTANLRATEVLIANPGAAAFTPGGALGTGVLAIQADKLVLGAGSKAIQGFSKVGVTANELIGRGMGSTGVAAETNLNVARISGEQAANQTLAATGNKLNIASIAADRTLAAVNTLGAKWALSGTELVFDTQASLPSGQFKLTATGVTGNLELGANAETDVAGRAVGFFDVSRSSPGGKIELISNNANVVIQSGAKVNVSAAAGGDAGELIMRASKGTVTVADGSLQGSTPVDTGGKRGEGARIDLDVNTLTNFSVLNTALNTGGFDGSRTVRVQSGDVSVAAADMVQAKDVHITVDGGKLDVAGHIDASGENAGRIGLYANGDVNMSATAQLDAFATGALEKGGKVEIATVSGSLDLATGSTVNVQAGSGGENGKVLLRAPRTGTSAGTEVAVSSLNSIISGAQSVAVEAVKVYSNIDTLNDTGASSGTTLSLATVKTDNNSFATQYAAIKSRLGKTGDTNFHVRAGVEVRSTGDLTLNKDWNLGDGTSRPGGEPGVLTLQAAGNLNLNNNLSDGFNVATPFNSGTTPATLLAGDSWSYRLIAGADAGAADPLAVKAGSADVTLAANKLVRTGTGDIQVASGRDIILGNKSSVTYTAGRVADAVSGFTTPTNAQFSQGGGDVSLTALGDITGTASAQLYSNWLFRQGQLNAAATAYTLQPAWWVRFDQFQQGVGALGGGDVTLHAGGNVQNVSASTPTQARMTATVPNASALVITGGGEVRVEAGSDLLGGQYYADRGDLVITASGKVDSGQMVGTGASAKPLYTILALGDSQARVRAQGDVNIQTVLNPHLVVQSAGSGTSFNITNANSNLWSLFSTYGEDSGAHLESLNNNVTLFNGGNGSSPIRNAYTTPLNFSISTAKYNVDLLSVLPPSLSATTFQGDILLNGTITSLSPAMRAGMTLLAANSISISTSLAMSDMDPALIPDAVRPGFARSQFFPNTSLATTHAPSPVHAGDTQPVRVYAVAGDIVGMFNKVSLTLPKAVRVRASQDVSDLAILAQHVNIGDVSRVEAGRDIVFTSGINRTDFAKIWMGGLGRLEVTAGRDIDLGTSAGIVSRGDLDNPALPKGGMDIHLAAGVGSNGIDYSSTVNRLIASLEAAGASPDDALLWQARWLVGDDALSGNNALAAVKAVAAQDIDTQRGRVREMIYTALLVTGRDSNNPDSPYAADYARGYAALELIFPGIGEKTPDGSSKNYPGEINLFASRVKTERGGNIEFMVPGGDLIVGLSNTPAALLSTGNDVLGMVTVADGSIRGFARDNILVNQSRIITVGGSDVLLWSSGGDIDAGKGKKTATTVPPPVIKVDAQGNVTQELQGAASGSGIGALSSGGVAAGDIDLIAPKGTVNAGDAGIRANNLNIAANVVLGADNLSVAGTTTGAPVADTSAMSAVSSGATSQGDGVSNATAALTQNLADSARNSQNLRNARPTFISAEVIGRGE